MSIVDGLTHCRAIVFRTSERGSSREGNGTRFTVSKGVHATARTLLIHVSDGQGTGIDVNSCQHLELLFAHLFQKHLEWQVDRRSACRQGSARRPTMLVARMDIKTAFDVARPKHIAKVLEAQDTHIDG